LIGLGFSVRLRECEVCVPYLKDNKRKQNEHVRNDDSPLPCSICRVGVCNSSHFPTVVGDSPVPTPVTAPAPAPNAAEVAMKARLAGNHVDPSTIEMPFRKSAVAFRYSVESTNLHTVAYFSKLGTDVASLEIGFEPVHETL
jgi:hypothetical protein